MRTCISDLCGTYTLWLASSRKKKKRMHTHECFLLTPAPVGSRASFLRGMTSYSKFTCHARARLSVRAETCARVVCRMALLYGSVANDAALLTHARMLPVEHLLGVRFVHNSGAHMASWSHTCMSAIHTDEAAWGRTTKECLLLVVWLLLQLHSRFIQFGARTVRCVDVLP